LKPVIIIAIAIVLLIPISVFAQENDKPQSTNVRNGTDIWTFVENSTGRINIWLPDSEFETAYYLLSDETQVNFIGSWAAQVAPCDYILENYDQIPSSEQEHTIETWKSCANGEIESDFLTSKLNEVIEELKDEILELREDNKKLLNQNEKLSDKLDKMNDESLRNNIIIAIVSIVAAFVVSRHFFKKKPEIVKIN